MLPIYSQNVSPVKSLCCQFSVFFNLLTSCFSLNCRQPLSSTRRYTQYSAQWKHRKNLTWRQYWKRSHGGLLLPNELFHRRVETHQKVQRNRVLVPVWCLSLGSNMSHQDVTVLWLFLWELSAPVLICRSEIPCWYCLCLLKLNAATREGV